MTNRETNGPVRGPAENVLEVVRTLRDGLRRSDRKVADVVLADPRRILNATVAETAEIAAVSQPTVIRFCSAIGCQGFQDFKLRLAQSLALGTPATHSVLSGSDTLGEIVGKIFDYTITSLDWARHHLDPAALEAAVEAILAAGHLEFFGHGASGIVAADAQQKFPLFGISCGAQTDSHQQIMAASMMTPDQVAIVFSNTGRTRSIIGVARTARETGATVIGVMGGDAPLARYCDIVLKVETLDNTNIYTPTISRIAALAVVDVLSTAVALRRDDAHRKRFMRMKQQLNELRFENETP
ncbi:SIS domain-containing protein [Pseudoxanthobacter sp.]|uniref:SIS domain-containing protein n=1 Tax=Pseudoxanthobacter sp. TaxID=1925742 RepID=UPI002FDF5C64